MQARVMDVVAFPSKLLSLLWKTVLENGWFESFVLLILITISAVAELFSKVFSEWILSLNSFNSLLM